MDDASNTQTELRNAEEGVSLAVRPIDQAVLDLLRRHGSLSIQELIEQLSVTATAVRQRLDRLEELRLIVKEKQGIGRGRPSFRYSITALGLRYAGVSYADLALALWQEVSVLPSGPLKDGLLSRVSARMGRVYRDEIQGETVFDRMSGLAKALGERKIPASVIQMGQLPVLEVQSCPYPDLVQGEHSRHLCEMEQEVLSTAMGQPMELSCCRLDGHNSCQFRPMQTTDNSGH